MNHPVHYNACPVCSSGAIHFVLTVKDHSVSGEDFAVWACNACALRFTQNAPGEEEIGRYYKSDAYISHTNTSKGFINQLYLRVRKFTLKLKSDAVEKHTQLSTGSLLDVGAGTGAFLQYMQQQGWHATGVEPDAGARRTAKQNYGLTLRTHGDLKNLLPQSFDAITLWHVLEHVHHLHDTMDILKSLLKPGGKLFIAVPNYQSLDAEVYGAHWAAYDVPRHRYHFSPKAIHTLMQRHGLTVIAEVPMWFDAFYISLLSSKYKNNRPNWPGAVSSGIRSNLHALRKKQHCSSLIYIISQ